MAEKFSLTDALFNKTKVEQIAGRIQRAHPAFREKDFIREVVARFPELELKARISWIAECLKEYLPSDYGRAVGILIKALPEPNNPELSDDDFGDFIYAPFADYVATNGCTKGHLRLSLDALYKITQRFSAEDAIRYFINEFPKETLKTLQQWSDDPHYHVRRLCSEGTRPKLPWSRKINLSASAPLPILNTLFADRTRFVTRSVANHLNDISKLDPDLVISTLTEWRNSGKQKPEEMEYIVRHALRTLVKEGNPKAMRLLGFSPTPRVSVSRFAVPKAVAMNSVLEFSFTIASEVRADILADYTIYFQNKSGELNSRKVFKLTKLALEKNKPRVISKRHMLRERMTTRTLYSGKHELEIQINGKPVAKKSFLLK